MLDRLLPASICILPKKRDESAERKNKDSKKQLGVFTVEEAVVVKNLPFNVGGKMTPAT